MHWNYLFKLNFLVFSNYLFKDGIPTLQESAGTANIRFWMMTSNYLSSSVNNPCYLVIECLLEEVAFANCDQFSFAEIYSYCYFLVNLVLIFRD